MTGPEFDRLFGGPPRKAESTITQREMDLAASIQKVTEEVVLRMARTAKTLTGSPNLCLAGGVALNCVANGKLLRIGTLRRRLHHAGGGRCRRRARRGAVRRITSLLDDHASPATTRHAQGFAARPQFSQRGDSRASRSTAGAPYTFFERRVRAACRPWREELASDKVIGWFHGRMEFGPRALGAAASSATRAASRCSRR